MPFGFAGEALHEEIHQRTHFGCEMARMGIDGVNVKRFGLERFQDRAQAP